MIHLVEGDILLSHAQAIAQGVGINDPMDKGLALSLHTLNITHKLAKRGHG